MRCYLVVLRTLVGWVQMPNRIKVVTKIHNTLVRADSSSKTLGQLVTMTWHFWREVYLKSGKAPWPGKYFSGQSAGENWNASIWSCKSKCPGVLPLFGQTFTPKYGIVSFRLAARVSLRMRLIQKVQLCHMWQVYDSYSNWNCFMQINLQLSLEYNMKKSLDFETITQCSIAATCELTLNPEQEVRVLAVLPTRYGKSLIYQMFVCTEDYQMNGRATIKLLLFLHWLALEKINQDQPSLSQS